MIVLVYASSETNERDLVALRVATSADGILADGANALLLLLRHGATISDIAMTIGFLGYAQGEARVRFSNTECLGAAIGQSDGLEPGCDREAIMLHAFAQQLERLSNPLIVTCGGAALDLPLLRYRCFAKLIPLPTLHLSISNRFKYFDRHDVGWHLDIADLLSGGAGGGRLDIHALCPLADIPLELGPGDCLVAESMAVFALFVRFLRLTGQMNAADYSNALKDLEKKLDVERTSIFKK